MTETAPVQKVDELTPEQRWRRYPVRQVPCKNPARAEAKRLAAKAERQRRRRAQKRAR